MRSNSRARELACGIERSATRLSQITASTAAPTSRRPVGRAQRCLHAAPREATLSGTSVAVAAGMTVTAWASEAAAAPSGRARAWASRAMRLLLAVPLLACVPACTLLDPVDGLSGPPLGDGGGISSDDGGDGPPTRDAARDSSETGDSEARGSGAGGSGAGSSPSGDSGAPDSGAASDSGPAAADGSPEAPPPTIASAYAAAVMADSPLGYWPLGDSSVSSSCHDASGNGHDGTMEGAVNLGLPGPFADGSITAASFGGDGADVDLGSTFSFSGSAPFSWEIWAAPSTLPGNAGAFLSAMEYDSSGGPVSGEYLIAYSSNGNTLGFEMYGPGAPGFVALECGGAGGLSVNHWSYVVATWDGSGNANIYVDGVSSNSESGVAGQLSTPSGVDTLLGQYFNGTLSEVAIYDHALTPGQIEAHWKAGMKP